MSISLKIKEIMVLKYESTQFAKLFLFFLRENDKGQNVYALFKYKLHLVKGFRANILIGNNILIPKDFILNVRLGYTIMRNCEVKINIHAK